MPVLTPLSRRSVLKGAMLAGLPGAARPAEPGRTASIGADLSNDGPRTDLAGITVPAARARVLAIIRLGDVPAACLAFAADLPEGTRDLFAVAAAGRVTAIDLLTWRGTDGSRLFTRLSAVPDGCRLRLERTASAPRGRGVRREAWTDYLAWRAGGAMTDAPVRPVLAGTWQAALAEQRGSGLALLTEPPNGVPAALAAALPAPHLG
jgi:hypothetical protein